MAVEYELNNSGLLSIKVSGRFDQSLHDTFRKITKEANEARTIIVDLKKSESIDSSALGMLLLLYDKVEGDKKAIRIENAPENIRKSLAISGLDNILTVI